MTRTPSEFSVRTRGLQIAGLSWGEPGLPVMLALHGWLDNANSFIRLAPLLTQHQVIAVDFPGHGLSDHRPNGCPYYFADYVLDVVHILVQMTAAKVDLLGHSLGAGVACCVAGGKPELVDNLLLIDGIGPKVADGNTATHRLNRGLGQYSGASCVHLSYPSLDDLIARRAAVTGYMPQEMIKAIVSRNSKRTERGWSWRTDFRLKFDSLMMFHESEVLNILAHIESSVLHFEAIDGVKHLFPQWQLRMEKIRNLENVQLPGHHHMHMDGQVEAIASCINHFCCS